MAALREQYRADVLVIGGGLAGCWAALAAARAGGRVILAEKGYVGTSGVTATAGPGHWWVPPNPPEVRERAIAERAARGLGLADPLWMARIIDLTWRSLPTLGRHYAFSADAQGVTQYRGLRGPEYMRAMRTFAIEAGVQILDQSPTHELLLDAHGVVSGALGAHRQVAKSWEVRAGAVVMATGGCAFFSHLLGSRNNTGDGYLMAAEAGAEFSGMEFSNYYTLAPARSNMTRSMAYMFARFFDEGGHELEIAPGPGINEKVARALMRGKVFCCLDRVPEDIRLVMPQVQPNFVAPFDRWGIDPYRDRFEVTLHGEGTVRGIGGLRVTNDACATTVPGLYAAGDAATRELIAGAVSGGGAQNSAWALSSGQWAGQGALRFARERLASPERQVEGIGEVGTGRKVKPLVSSTEVIAALRKEMETPARNMFRHGAQLQKSLNRMDGLWAALQDQGLDEEVWRARELAAGVATARLCLSSALARCESRGMHQRTDFPALAKEPPRRLISKGLSKISLAYEASEKVLVP